MALLSKEKEAIKNNYFSLWEIISLLAKKADDDLQEVGEFLGHVNISTEIQVYKRDQFSRLYQLDLEWDNNPVDEIVSILNGMIPFNSEEELNEAKNKARWKALDLYWLKEDIYNFAPIMRLGIIEKPQVNSKEINTPCLITTPPYTEKIDNDKYKFLLYKQPLFSYVECACIISDYDPLQIQNYPINDIDEVVPDYSRAYSLISSAVEAGKLNVFNYKIDADDFRNYLTRENIIIAGFNDQPTPQSNNKSTESHTELKNTIASLELYVAIEKSRVRELRAEIDLLKQQLQEKTAEIAQLKESQPVQPDSQNLMDLIFDESATERYAPDLAYAIQLWKSVYIDNNKIRSYSNKANTWIEKNTPYSGEQEDTPTRRLREIASSFNDWHISRKKLLKTSNELTN